MLIFTQGIVGYSVQANLCCLGFSMQQFTPQGKNPVFLKWGALRYSTRINCIGVQYNRYIICVRTGHNCQNVQQSEEVLRTYVSTEYPWHNPRWDIQWDRGIYLGISYRVVGCSMGLPVEFPMRRSSHATSHGIKDIPGNGIQWGALYSAGMCQTIEPAL